jgi:hypothetical protein
MDAWVNGLRITKSVHIGAPYLTLAAIQKSGPAGRTVTFTPRWSDGAAVSGATWTWAPDTAPGQTIACSGSPAICQSIIRNNGTMVVHVTRGGVTRTANAHVTNIPCPQNDSIVDNEETRMGLAFLFESNHGPVWQNRREQTGFLYLDTLTGAYSFMADLDPTRGTPCSTDVVLPTAPANSRLIAILHPHPLDAGIDILPAFGLCNEKGRLPGTGGLGVSPVDRLAADSLHVPVFAVDFKNIYRTDGAGTPGRTFSRSGTCTVLPPAVLNRKPVRAPFLLTGVVQPRHRETLP